MTLDLEAERRRYRERKKDPAFLAYKAEYARMWKAARRGDTAALDAHRARRAKRDAEARALREKRLAERKSYRTQMAERVASKRMSKAAQEPMIRELRRAEVELIDRVVRETLADGSCRATTFRGGFRVSCILRGEHTRHVGIHGDHW